MITPGPFQDAVAHVAAQEIAQAVDAAIGKVAQKFKISPDIAERRMNTVIMFIYEADVAAYHQQGWICSRLRAHHGARRLGKNFMAVMEGFT